MHIHTHLVFRSLQGLGPVPSSGLLKCYLIIQVFCFFSNGKDVTNLEITSSIQFILISFCLFISVKCPYEKLNLFFPIHFFFQITTERKSAWIQVPRMGRVGVRLTTAPVTGQHAGRVLWRGRGEERGDMNTITMFSSIISAKYKRP